MTDSGTTSTVDVRQYLLRHGIRPSVQRMAVMGYLTGNPTHPTVEQIYAALSPAMPSLSKTTVYNTLKILQDRGAILALDIDPLCERFDADTSLHAHAYCTECGSVSDVWLTDSQFAAKNAPNGMSVRSVQLLYRGVCAVCEEKLPHQ